MLRLHTTEKQDRISNVTMASWASMAASAASIPEPVQQPPRRTAPQRAAAATPQPQGENEQIFVAAVQHVFARWSLLRLAIDMGWGDGDGTRNQQKLLDETLQLFQVGGRGVNDATTKSADQMPPSAASRTD